MEFVLQNQNIRGGGARAPVPMPMLNIQSLFYIELTNN